MAKVVDNEEEKNEEQKIKTVATRNWTTSSIEVAKDNGI